MINMINNKGRFKMKGMFRLGFIFILTILFSVVLSFTTTSSFSQTSETSKKDKEKSDEVITVKEGTNLNIIVRRSIRKTKLTGGGVSLQAKDGFIYMSNDNKYYVSQNQRIWIGAQEKISENVVEIHKIEVKVDDGEFYEYLGSKPLDFAVFKEGPHKITIRATDKNKNVITPHTFDVIVDNTPPSIQLKYEAKSPGKYYSGSNATYVPKDHKIFVHATDSASGVNDVQVAMNDGSFQDIADGDFISLAKTGWNTIRVKAKDNVLNESKETIFNVCLDITPPRVAISSNYPIIASADKKYQDKPEIKPIEKPIEKPVTTKPTTDKEDDEIDKEDDDDDEKEPKKSPEGSKVNEVTPIEEIGFIYNKDYQPGQSDSEDKDDDDDDDSIEDDSKETGITKVSTIYNVFYLIGYDSESGVSLIEYKIDGDKDWKAYNEPIQFSKLGKHVIEVRATDNVGNVSVSKLEVFVDKTAPKVNGDNKDK